MANEAIHGKLLTALTRYDERQSRGKYYNPWALAHYCEALGSVMRSIETGRTPREALTGHFCGRLLDLCLKAIGETPSTREEQRGGMYRQV